MSAIRQMLERAIEYYETKPERARMTSTVSCTLVGPTETIVHSDGHEVVTDEPRYAGGADRGPSPGNMALVALASCQAVAYRYWSELLGVRFDTLEIQVEGDLDRRGPLGFEGVRAGFTDVRMVLHVTGEAGAEAYQEVLDRASAACTVSDVFRSPVAVHSEVRTS